MLSASLSQKIIPISGSRRVVISFDILVGGLDKVLKVLGEQDLTARAWIAHPACTAENLFALRVVLGQKSDDDMNPT